MMMRVACALSLLALTGDVMFAQSEAILHASNRQRRALFGGSVAVDGDTAVVGAGSEGVYPMDDSGAAYVFSRDHGASALAKADPLPLMRSGPDEEWSESGGGGCGGAGGRVSALGGAAPRALGRGGGDRRLLSPGPETVVRMPQGFSGGCCRGSRRRAC